jgi:putative ABC transport system permease protein
MRESLRQTADTTLLMRTRCSDAIRDAAARVPGVKGAACSGYVTQVGVGGVGPVQYKDGERLVLGEVAVGVGYLELYGIELAAGRYFSEDFGADRPPQEGKWTVPESILVNEAGVAKLGLASPQAAIGELVNINHPSAFAGTFSGEHAAQIVGVVKNFQIGTVRRDFYPTVFFVDPGMFGVLSMKLDGRSTPETLDAIDRLWARMGDRPGPPDRWFFEQTVQNIYGDLRRDFDIFSVSAGIAILISALGLVGLAAHAASARTKEIGVRKVLGGGRAAIMGLLMWQFSRPVLLANAIAWPAAYFFMSRWLEGFARRIDLEPWMFVAAAVGTLALAAATVVVHAWTIAGVRPVVALRHE